MPPYVAAATATGSTGSLAADRLAALHSVRELLVADRRRVRRLLTELATYRAAEYEVDAALATLAGAADEVATYRPRTLPRMAVFMPSNVLLYSYVLYLLVPSLFVERICFRPSRRAAAPLLRLHELLASAHQLPVAPMNTSQREFLRVGVAGADLVVFTGTYQNAELIRPKLRPDQLFVYLGGGVNPFVVAPGADLDRAVRDAVDIRLLNSGQDCLAPDVFFVNHRDRDELLERLVQRLSELRCGPYTDPSADYGPIAYDSALEQAALYLLRHARQLVHGGHLDVVSRVVEPAVVAGELTGGLGRTELFAPIFHVVSYRDEDVLIRTLTTGTFAERALGASVYGAAPRLVEALAERHTVTLGTTLLAVDDGNAPFGGWGAAANYVARAGRVRAEPILLSKAVADHLAADHLAADRPALRAGVP